MKKDIRKVGVYNRDNKKRLTRHNRLFENKISNSSKIISNKIYGILAYSPFINGIMDEKEYANVINKIQKM